MPQRIVMELTPHCNLSCHMCPRHYISSEGGYMSMALWRKLIDEIAAERFDCVVLPFWRGESLLHPEFCRCMDYALERGIRLHMCTNGHHMTEVHRQTLLKLEFVTFSIHSGEGLANARAFAAMRSGNSPTVQASFVDCEETAASFLDALVRAADLGGFDSIRLYKEHTRDGVWGRGEAAGPRTFCQKLCDTLVIAWDGTVSRCNHQWQTDNRLNANSMSIKQIWDSPEMTDIRSHYPDEACSGCQQWSGHTQGERWQLLEGKVCHTKF